MPETANKEPIWREDARWLAGLAARLADPVFPAADRAALRRMDPRARSGAAEIAIERLLVAVNADPDGNDRCRWALIVHSIALVRGQHDPKAPLGQILFDCHYSEDRLNRLLRADFEGLIDLLPRLARFLAANNAAADWLPLARIVRWTGRLNDIADDCRLRIARNYARASAPKETTR